ELIAKFSKKGRKSSLEDIFLDLTGKEFAQENEEAEND
ncbi:MAG: hypothetical protein CEN91_489, partial [Candidatus Berkelbacteria bacterium Licking1014_85]